MKFDLNDKNSDDIGKGAFYNQGLFLRKRPGLFCHLVTEGHESLARNNDETTTIVKTLGSLGKMQCNKSRV